MFFKIKELFNKLLNSFVSLGIIAIEKLYDILIKFSTEAIMEIKRDRYLNQLISYMWDGQVKVITGIRRCGKSYLLRTHIRAHKICGGNGKHSYRFACAPLG